MWILTAVSTVSFIRYVQNKSYKERPRIELLSPSQNSEKEFSDFMFSWPCISI